MTTIRKTSVEAIMGAREFPVLIAEYAREALVDGMPSPIVKLESYRALDRTGTLHVFSAVKDGELIGFITVLAPPMPHYDAPVAVSESFFVASAHRAGGPGLRLLSAAEQQARACGSGLFVCAPMGGRLVELLPKCGYAESNRVFFKPFGALAAIPGVIKAMSPAEIANVQRLEDLLLATEPQIDLEYQHELYAGIYDRTVRVPAGMVITGAPVKIETLLTISGDVIVGLDGNETRLTGYAKLRAEAHRKSVFTAISDTLISMSFATDAATVAEAESQFTDEPDRLASRRITGEPACRV